MSRRLVALATLALVLQARPGIAGPEPDPVLSIAKVATGSEAMSPPAPAGALIPGNLVTYTNTAQNAGPSAALNLTITDPLPAETVFISAVASPGASLTTPAVGANGSVMSVWDAGGGTPAGLTGVGVSRTLTIVARICPEAGCTDIVNTATVSSANPEVSGDDSTTTTPLFPQSDLTIGKTASVGEVKPGDSFTYTLTVANAGPSNSPTTQVVDTLPPDFIATNVETTIPGASCSITAGGQTVTCTFGLGAANQCATTLPTSGTIIIDVKVSGNASPVVHTNSATISVTGVCGIDPNPANNTATAAVEVRGAASVPALSPLALAALAILLGVFGMRMMKRAD